MRRWISSRSSGTRRTVSPRWRRASSAALSCVWSRIQPLASDSCFMMQWMSTTRPVRPLAVYEQFRYGMRHLAPAPAGTPTLLIVGDHEVVQAKSAPHILSSARRRIPNIMRALAKNGGHAVTIDQPATTNYALLEFLLTSTGI